MKIFAIITVLWMGCGVVMASEHKEIKTNEIVNFLIGKWENVSFEISDGTPIKREAYLETMLAKNFDTLSITAHGFREGKDLTKDMKLELQGDDITLTQGFFVAKGKREDQLYALKGTHAGIEYRFRLYALGDKYVFHRETWKDGKIRQIDMSYLTRSK